MYNPYTIRVIDDLFRQFSESVSRVNGTITRNDLPYVSYCAYSSRGEMQYGYEFFPDEDGDLFSIRCFGTLTYKSVEAMRESGKIFGLSIAFMDTSNYPASVVVFLHDSGSVPESARKGISVSMLNYINFFDLTNCANIIKSVNGIGARSALINAYKLVRRDPSQLSGVYNKIEMGYMFSYMLCPKISSDIDILQSISSISYLFLSLGLLIDSTNTEVKKQRIRTMFWGMEAFGHTAWSYSGELMDIYDGFSIYKRPEDYTAKMIIADMEDDPQLKSDVEFRVYWDASIRRFKSSWSDSEPDSKQIASEGRVLHSSVLEGLRKQIIEEADIEF